MNDSHSPASNMIEQGFKPLLGLEPKVLILGSMPSVQSLKSQEYYGHPRNAFWWIMSELCQFDPNLPYSEKVKATLKSKIAVWDVIASCHRPGSLDSKIDQNTVTPNNFSSVFEQHSSIQLIAFNGQAAEKLFRKFIDERLWKGEVLILPSTSPANAAITRAQKLKRWEKIKDYLA